jgi:oligopeptide/dipeptide ABC transporter ATP-binding protein
VTPSSGSAEPLLEMCAVEKSFPLSRGLLNRLLGRGPTLHAVIGVDLSIRRREIVGLVGESGSGKTTLGQIAVRLMAPSSGRLRFAGQDVTVGRGSNLCDFRRRVQMIFQDTNSSLNPRKRVKTVIGEALRLRGTPRRERRREAERVLETVGLGSDALQRYPHQLSGGQRQRIGIARALAMQPDLLIADEPVSSLDVSLQSQIINLLIDLRTRLGLAILFISHDLALVGFMCDRVAVMHGGHIVEEGLPAEVLRAPAHPYTQALIAAVPAGLAGRRRGRTAAAVTIDRAAPQAGCPFAARCPQALARCREIYPPSIALSPTHRAECHLLDKAG